MLILVSALSFTLVCRVSGEIILEEIIQIQEIKETSTPGVIIATVNVAINEDRQFEINAIDKVISHHVNMETTINYMGIPVHNVTVLGYDGMKVGFIIFSGDGGIIDYRVKSFKKIHN